jgi:integrase
MDKSKRSKKVGYWLSYRFSNGKQRREFIGYSITEARDAKNERMVQRRDNQPSDPKITFNDLSAWYCDLETVKYLNSYGRIKVVMKNFNNVFGRRRLSSIKPIDIENYQLKREKEGRAPATIDMEVKIVQTAVTKAFDNDIISGQALKAFRKVKRKLKKGSNARKRILKIDEYLNLKTASPAHLKAMIEIAYNTGC